MTSLLPPLEQIFHPTQAAAQLESNRSLEVQPDNDHGLLLPVSILGKSSEAHTNDAVLLHQLRNEVGVRVRRSLVEDEDRIARSSSLSNGRHHSTSHRDVA